MNVKGSNSMLHFSFCMTTMFFAIIVLTVIIFGSLTSNVNHIVIAQQQENKAESNNQTLSHTKQQPPPFMEDLSFYIDDVTFSHHMASVNGIQLHYVKGGQGDPIVLLHGFPQSWYEWRHIMPALAKNYTVIVPDLRGFGDSSKPITGYDGKTTAEDIYQLVSQLDFNNQP
ncbi:MAG TPA: alpha/beta fold hydrolase, partial [Nitrososphaeraceae archaeon]|nr:alpha/beta fold hydrolase [Nitrososphaeraceae archaeon]